VVEARAQGVEEEVRVEGAAVIRGSGRGSGDSTKLISLRAKCDTSGAIEG
jgi:hypothetical protein